MPFVKEVTASDSPAVYRASDLQPGWVVRVKGGVKARLIVGYKSGSPWCNKALGIDLHREGFPLDPTPITLYSSDRFVKLGEIVNFCMKKEPNNGC